MTAWVPRPLVLAQRRPSLRDGGSHGRRAAVPHRAARRGPGRAARPDSGRRTASRPPRVRIDGEIQGRGAPEPRPPAGGRVAHRSAICAADLREEQGVHGDRDRDARPRHRREHGGLQRRRCAAAPHAAGGRAGRARRVRLAARAGCDGGALFRIRPAGTRRPRDSHLLFRAHGRGVCRTCCHPGRRHRLLADGHAERRGRSAGGYGIRPLRHRTLFRGARRTGGPRAHLVDVGRSPGRGAGGGDQPSILAASLRGRSGRDRKNDRRQPAACRDRGRHARGIRWPADDGVERHHAARGCRRPPGFGRPRARRVVLVAPDDGAPEAWRHARAGPRRAAADLRGDRS